MILPNVNEIHTSRDMIDTFGGYNHNLRIGSGEFYDMENLSSTHYPLLSPRPKRGTFAPEAGEAAINPQGLIAKDSLGYVDGRYFVLNEYRIDLGLSTDEKDCPKTLISMGAFVIILPDKKWINTADITENGNIEATYTSLTTNSVSFELCTIDGAAYTNTQISASEPANPTDKDYWIDTSATPHALKQYSATSSMWVSVATTYIKITSPGIGLPFEQYDGVTISGIKNTSLSDLNSTMVIWEKGDNYIVVIGMLDGTIVQQGSEGVITVKRQMPIMDFVTESENRLWGCHYGVAANGEIVNEIYASKLGDFKNWNCFMGISTDSYAATVGTDGQFTAAVTHLGYPLFFKETCVHKVFGSFPAAYQIQTTNCRGVAKGSEKSLATVNEVLYYKSRNGVCAYDGSLPVEISSALGEATYSDAVGGCLGNKYYISMKDTASTYHLFVYDTVKGMWHREDNTQAKEFCNCRGELYYIDTKAQIKTILGSGTKDTDPIKWMAETGVIGTSMPDKKYISRLLVRMSLEIGAKVMFFIQYDSMGEFEHLFTMTGSTLNSFTVPIKPSRCDHFRLRIEGIGDAKIYSITKTIEQGSDV